MSPVTRCPACGMADQVEKVSKLYIMGIEKPKPGGNGPGIENSEQASNPLWQRKDVLSHRLKPPSSGKAPPSRPLHPDLVVLVFSLILPIFIYGIFTSQSSLFLPALAFLAFFYGFYFIMRKTIIARFEKQKLQRQSAEGQAKRAIGRWMRLYYCLRDDGVFEPGSEQIVPADEMTSYLFRD